MDGFRSRERGDLDELPELYTILRGEVASVTAYGAFVKIPGCRKQGLVHKSEMSSCRVENPSELVDIGEKVWVKVIGREVQDGKVKLSFSMKVVNQGTGKDLDPNNVVLEQDERKRRQFRDHSSQRITLEAVLNTTCKNCGCKGHFTKDCYSQPGLQYSLVPEEEAEPSQSAQTQPHSKKEKKVKKRKKRETSTDSSDSEDGPGPARRGRSTSETGSGEGRRKEKKKKERKKEEKKKKKKKKDKKGKHKSHGKQE